MTLLAMMAGGGLLGWLARQLLRDDPGDGVV